MAILVLQTGKLHSVAEAQICPKCQQPGMCARCEAEAMCYVVSSSQLRSHTARHLDDLSRMVATENIAAADACQLAVDANEVAVQTNSTDDNRDAFHATLRALRLVLEEPR